MTPTDSHPSSRPRTVKPQAGDLIRFTGYYQKVLGSYLFSDTRSPKSETEVVDQWEWILTADWHQGIVTDVSPSEDCTVLHVLTEGFRAMVVMYPQEEPWSEGSVVEVLHAAG